MRADRPSGGQGGAVQGGREGVSVIGRSSGGNRLVKGTRPGRQNGSKVLTFQRCGRAEDTPPDAADPITILNGSV
ncbi:hypothetical protein GCM10009099_16790 [Caenispirillum bisanense]